MKRKLFDYWIKLYLYNNRLILNIKRKRWTGVDNIILLILSPYFLLRYLLSVIYEHIYGFKHIYKLNKQNIRTRFKHKLGMVCIAKNEGPYIKEWIEYHRCVGFDIFYFYDNDSNDETRDVLKDYIEQGLVIYTLIKGKGMQLCAYNDAIDKYKNDCKYMAFLDLDEYLFPMQPNCEIDKLLDSWCERYPGASGCGVNWCIFGSSGHKKRPSGLIIENYINRGDDKHWANYHVKTICNPRRVKYFISPHYPLYKLGAFSVTDSGYGKRQYGWFNRDVHYSTLRINHYYTKSEEDYVRKISRGLGDREGHYDLSQFNKYNLNDIKDDSMRRYWDILKSKMGK